MFFIAESRAANQLKKLASIESRNGELGVLVKPSPPPRGAKGGREVKETFGGMKANFGTAYGGRSRTNDADDISMQEDASEVIQVCYDNM